MTQESKQHDSTLRNRFLVDGRQRLCAALEPQVRAEVTAEYAERLAQASFFSRLWLRREINREIERRLAEKAPPEALY